MWSDTYALVLFQSQTQSKVVHEPMASLKLYQYYSTSNDFSSKQEQLLDCKGEDGWNKLFDLIQSELYARPDDVHVNIRLVELYRSNKRLKDAVAHCHEAEKNITLRSSLEWNSCVVQTLKVGESYLSPFLDAQVPYVPSYLSVLNI